MVVGYIGSKDMPPKCRPLLSRTIVMRPVFQVKLSKDLSSRSTSSSIMDDLFTDMFRKLERLS